tara:strand:+ start:2004 stop:3683 length:1680 start_codon:yes stop_codon:yes gene_type:complete
MGSGKKQVYTFQNLIAPAPPESEASRINQQSLRVRLLRGMQEPDVENEIAKNFAPEVAYDLTYNPDLSSNVFLECWQQLAIAYDTYPNVSIDGDESLGTIITPDLWPLCQTRQLTQIAVNEAVIRLDWPSNENELQEVKYRVVSPNMIYGARSSKADPSQPDYVCELRVRTKENAVDCYTFETWDVSNPDDPKFSIHEEIEGELVDRTSYYLGKVEDYPYRDRDGAPILPYVFYHKKIQSQLWDWQNGIEVVKGTLRLAAGFTFFWDSFLNASSPVRVAIDLDLPAGNGLQMRNGGALQQVVYSPKTIIKMQSTVDRTGRIDTFPVGMSPEEGLESLKSYAERLAMYCGISGADLQTKNGGAKSGIAIIVSRDGMRRAQMRAEPANRKGDQIMLARAAKLSNAYGGTNLPEEPREYRISYALIGQSPFERKEELANVEKELSMNLISQVDATRRLYPEIESEEEAVGYLLGIREQDRALAQAENQGVEGVEIATENLQSTALNGAQVTSAQGIIETVAAGRLPRATGVSMLSRFFGIDYAVANEIMGSVGGGFTPTKEA